MASIFDGRVTKESLSSQNQNFKEETNQIANSNDLSAYEWSEIQLTLNGHMVKD